MSNPPTYRGFHELYAGTQRFLFEVDEDSVLLEKHEHTVAFGNEELGSVLIYENQLDAVIAKLTEIRDGMRGGSEE